MKLTGSLNRTTKNNRPFAQLLAWVRDGASGDGRSVTCTWIAPRTARNGDKKSTSRPSETLKLHVGDWPTVTGCPVSNPGNNCANGLLKKMWKGSMAMKSSLKIRNSKFSSCTCLSVSKLSLVSVSCGQLASKIRKWTIYYFFISLHQQSVLKIRFNFGCPTHRFIDGQLAEFRIHTESHSQGGSVSLTLSTNVFCFFSSLETATEWPVSWDKKKNNDIDKVVVVHALYFFFEIWTNFGSERSRTLW